RKALPLDADEKHLEEAASPPDSSAFEEVEYRQYLVGRALEIIGSEFPPTTWKAFWEYVVCGRPAAEVAAELGLREGTVWSAKCRGLTRLRQALDGLLD